MIRRTRRLRQVLLLIYRLPIAWVCGTFGQRPFIIHFLSFPISSRGHPVARWFGWCSQFRSTCIESRCRDCTTFSNRHTFVRFFPEQRRGVPAREGLGNV